MTDYKALYEEKCDDFQILDAEYDEFKEISKMFEGELQSALDIATQSIKDKETQYEQLDERTSKKIKKCEDELDYLNKLVDKLQKENKNLQQKIQTEHRRLVNLEIENDDYDSQFRAKNFLIEDLERKSDVVYEKQIILQQETEFEQIKSTEENDALKKRIEETEYELELIRKKGISIKVIDNNITKIQKKRNQMKQSNKDAQYKYQFNKSGSIAGYPQKPDHEERNSTSSRKKDILKEDSNQFWHIPVVNDEAQKIKGDTTPSLFKSNTLNVSQYIDSNENTVKNSEIDLKGVKTPRKISNVSRESDTYQTPGSKNLNNKDLNEIKKFLSGVNNHTRKKQKNSRNDYQWDNVSFGLRSLLKKMDDKIVGIKQNLGI